MQMNVTFGNVTVSKKTANVVQFHLIYRITIFSLLIKFGRSVYLSIFGDFT